tara:strand:- start:578 stop:820 length:243 start_codon:yes stop_codon:yes gene_type:complete
MKIRQKLKDKIKLDTGYEVKNGDFYRATLTWSHASAGRMKWYWNINGYIVGSAENMKDLLSSPKIVADTSHFGFIEFSSS